MTIDQKLKLLLRPVIHPLRQCYIRIVAGRLELRSRFSRSSVVRADGPVVSLTTHGARLATVHLAIESIAGGTVLPSRMILWIGEETASSALPESIRRLQRRGLEVEVCEEGFGPHTKYYPYLKSAKTFDLPLVTADDDMIYPPYWLQRLHRSYRKHPDEISCYRAGVVSTKCTTIARYLEWPDCRSRQARFNHFAKGVSGVIYPPEFLAELKKAGAGFVLCCPRADDIWLHVQAIRAGYRIRQTGSRALLFLTVPGTQENALTLYNCSGPAPANDEQVRMTYKSSDIALMIAEAAAGSPQRHQCGLNQVNIIETAGL